MLDHIFIILSRPNEGSIGDTYPGYNIFAYKIVDRRLLKDTHTHTYTHTDRHNPKHNSCPSQTGNYKKTASQSIPFILYLIQNINAFAVFSGSKVRSITSRLANRI